MTRKVNGRKKGRNWQSFHIKSWLIFFFFLIFRHNKVHQRAVVFTADNRILKLDPGKKYKVLISMNA